MKTIPTPFHAHPICYSRQLRCRCPHSTMTLSRRRNVIPFIYFPCTVLKRTLPNVHTNTHTLSPSCAYQWQREAQAGVASWCLVCVPVMPSACVSCLSVLSCEGWSESLVDVFSGGSVNSGPRHVYWISSYLFFQWFSFHKPEKDVNVFSGGFVNCGFWNDALNLQLLVLPLV